MRRMLGLVVTMAVAVLGIAGCEAEPKATVMLIGDSNWPSAEIVTAHHYAADHAPLTIVEDWPGLGVVTDLDKYEDGYAAKRVAAAQARADLDVVITNLGVNDAPIDPATWQPGIDALLSAAGGATVIWITPGIAGADQAAVSAFDDLLTANQATYPNLWVVPFDSLLDSMGGCPTLVGGVFTVAPHDACYSNRAADVHLASSGRILIALLTRVTLEATLNGQFRVDLGPLAADVVAQLSTS